MIERECLNCGKSFSVPYPSSKRVNCSEECRIARLRQPRRAPRADKGTRKVEWVTLTCKNCGEPFAVPPWEAESRRHCSQECRAQPPICTVEGCDRPTLSRKMCRYHYDEWKLERPGERERKAAYMREYRAKNLTSIRATEWRNNLKRYDVTPEQWQTIFEAQGRGCAICGNPESSNGHRLVVDHCHTSGLVRALLCHGCNRGMGLFADDSARLRAAADYLDAHKHVEL